MMKYVIMICAAVSLTACGRRGALELPSVETPQAEQKNIQSNKTEDKPFILDALIK